MSVFDYFHLISTSLEPHGSSEHGSLHSAVSQRLDQILALFWRLCGQRGAGPPGSVRTCLRAALQPQAFSKAKDPRTLSSPTGRPRPRGGGASFSFLLTRRLFWNVLTASGMTRRQRQQEGWFTWRVIQTQTQTVTWSRFNKYAWVVWG